MKANISQLCKKFVKIKSFVREICEKFSTILLILSVSENLVDKWKSFIFPFVSVTIKAYEIADISLLIDVRITSSLSIIGY